MHLQALVVIAILAAAGLSVVILLVLRERRRHLHGTGDVVVWCAQRQQRAIVDFVESDEPLWIRRSVLHCTLWSKADETCSEHCLAARNQSGGGGGRP